MSVTYNGPSSITLYHFSHGKALTTTYLNFSLSWSFCYCHNTLYSYICYKHSNSLLLLLTSQLSFKDITKKENVLSLPTYLPFRLLALIQISIWYNFTSSYRISFIISYIAVLLVMSSFSFGRSERLYFTFIFQK